MKPASWPCPLPGSGIAPEYALIFDRARASRLLIVPAFFDEGNRMRRLTVEVMRRLDAVGIDSFLPDLPGCNESLQPLDEQTPAVWNEAMRSAAMHFGATHVLGIRGGCLFTPGSLPRWHYAPVKGASILRQMMRARVLASREAGRDEKSDELATMARSGGIELAGYPFSADIYRALETTEPAAGATIIAQEAIGGAGLWLRAEPGENPAQADALASIIAKDLAP